MRKCCMCHELKSEEFFDRNSARGFSARCKSCRNMHQREYRKKHPGYNSLQCKKHYSDNKDRVDSQIIKWRTADPLRYRAHNALHYEVKMGRIVKPDNCSICGETAQVVGHHDDYSKPKEVRWLCRSCHKNLHLETSRATISSR